MYKSEFDEFRNFGVEIEMYNVNASLLEDALRAEGIEAYWSGYTHQISSRWKITTDSSVRGMNACELVSPILSGTEGLEQVRKVMAVARRLGGRVNKTCGFHVHWNCADFTGKNVQSLLRLYTKFEDVFDSIMPPSRRGDSNQFCRSLKKDSTLQWVTLLDQTGKKPAREVVGQFSDWYGGRYGSRYHKVNVSAYLLYGTIEFRQHQGTLNGDKAVQWIVLTQMLVNKAKRVSVSRENSAKPTLGELIRILRLANKHMTSQHPAPHPEVARLATYLKTRKKLLETEVEVEPGN